MRTKAEEEKEKEWYNKLHEEVECVAMGRRDGRASHDLMVKSEIERGGCVRYEPFLKGRRARWQSRSDSSPSRISSLSKTPIDPSHTFCLFCVEINDGIRHVSLQSRLVCIKNKKKGAKHLQMCLCFGLIPLKKKRKLYECE